MFTTWLMGLKLLLLRFSQLVFITAVVPLLLGSTLLTDGYPIHVRVESNSVEPETLIAGSDGYTVFVPQEAHELVVEFATNPSDKIAVVVGRNSTQRIEGLDSKVSYRWKSPDSSGLARIVIGRDSHPRLNDGIYSIGFEIFESGMVFEGYLSATLNRDPIAPKNSLEIDSNTPRTIIPTVTAFSAGLDGWSRNYPANNVAPESTIGAPESQLIWKESGGNPGGRVQLIGGAGISKDAFVASKLYLGTIAELTHSNPRLEFDYMHISDTGPTRPITVLLYGANETIFSWTGTLPDSFWQLQRVPISKGEWARVSGKGSFEKTVTNLIQMTISSDQSNSPEWNAIDNVALLTSNSPNIPMALSSRPETINFSSFVTGSNPTSQTLMITGRGGHVSWNAEVIGELASRILISETAGRTPSELTVKLNTQPLPNGNRPPKVEERLAVGFHLGSVVVTPVEANIPAIVIPISLSFAESASRTPKILSGGVVNSASYTNRLAPGGLGTILGTDLGGPETGILAEFQGRSRNVLPTNVAGVRLMVYGGSNLPIEDVPILYLDNEKINFQIPFEVAGLQEVGVLIDNNGSRSKLETVRIAPSAPGIFTHDGLRAIATNQNGSLNSPVNPAARHEVITVYMTGQGAVEPHWPTGMAANVLTPIIVAGDAHVFVGGVEGSIVFFGLAPKMVGVVQINFRPSLYSPPGDQAIQVVVDGYSSNRAQITIQ